MAVSSTASSRPPIWRAWADGTSLMTNIWSIFGNDFSCFLLHSEKSFSKKILHFLHHTSKSPVQKGDFRCRIGCRMRVWNLHQRGVGCRKCRQRTLSFADFLLFTVHGNGNFPTGLLWFPRKSWYLSPFNWTTKGLTFLSQKWHFASDKSNK